MATSEYDIVIVGAGISGIDVAYRVQDSLPGATYTLIEERNDLGGTWDFFKYPGLRSDSDMHTFGFTFRPWQGRNSIGTGAQIKKYLKETAEEFGIDKNIQYGHKLLSSDWSTETQRWRLEVQAGGKTKSIYCRFFVLGTGYYDYQAPLPAKITGIENFKGTIIHPQFWPEDVDYADKRIVIIGSGATAITLLPTLAQKCKKVTMVQRSPSYIMPLPQVEPFYNRFLPRSWAFAIARFYFLTIPLAFFYFCRAYPNAAKWVMKRRMGRHVPKNIPMDPHFLPTYGPWEQRLCASPDGDFYQCFQDGVADIKTGHIKGMHGNTIELTNGETADADILVTATGLNMRFAGGAAIRVDGKPVNFNEKFLWQGMMLQDVPNAAFVIGYTNSSWTLGADATALSFVRLYKHMVNTKATSCTPTVEADEVLEQRPVLNLNSTYIRAAESKLPMAADKGPWVARSNYFNDGWTARFGNLTTGLRFTRLSS